MDRWSGKTAVITGASGGIGSAIAQALAEAGLTVVGLDRREQKSGIGRVQYRRCDVSRQEEVEEAFAWINATFGGTDLLVNNAGLVYHGSITEAGPNPLTVEELMSQVDVNIKSLVLCSRQAARSMQLRNAPGHIININSVAGHQVPSAPIFNVYSGTKHAITAMTQTLHNEFSHFELKIKTTSISPGLVDTEMAQMAKMPELRAMVSRQPSLRPEDIADAVLYLLSTPPHVNIDELTITPLGEKRL